MCDIDMRDVNINNIVEQRFVVTHFVSRFVDEFSLLLQLRSSQHEDRSLFTFLCPDGHILLQIRISAHSFTFIGTQQRHYESVWAFLYTQAL